MLYRKLGRTGVDVSILGFGCMRFPLIGTSDPMAIMNADSVIDEVEAQRMIDRAFELGINYYDTAYGYHNGKSEPFVGKALKEVRDEVYIATKLPIWNIEKFDDCERIFNEQLTRLQTDYIDFYLMHGLNARSWKKINDMDIMNFVDDLVSDGKVKFVGFSFHDNVKVFKEIVDGYNWSFCQIQYNYYDENYQAGREGLEYAAAKGQGIIVMEPLRGGKLTNNLPPEVLSIFDSAEPKRTPAEWALRWVWNHPEVSTTLSGMSTMDQLIENLRIANRAGMNSLTTGELGLIGQVKDKLRELLKIDCTACAYCMPCPNGVDIPANLSIYNDAFLFGDDRMSKMRYNQFMAPEVRAENCAECGDCEEVCPQQIEVSKEMKKVHELLSKE
jgi:predicted aldo/keto reductase-like oxidoreductase